MRCARPRAGRGGFTLLEVFVAMAILATSLVVLLQNHSMSIRMSERARQTSIAANLARDLLTEVEIEGFPAVGAESGDFSARYPGLYPNFTWEREVTESFFVDFIRDVVVRVTYLEDGVPRTVEMIEMIAAKTLEEQEEGGINTGSGGPTILGDAQGGASGDEAE
ncbi:prepilin-type N-terminal cleavage/methylation domain-containing protein [bacterium]|nr:prepilin-type N-terminal cleavage/methylation domain-containing protein [bacterium]